MWGRFISFGPCNCDSKNAKGWMNKTASFFVVCLDVVLYMLGSNQLSITYQVVKSTSSFGSANQSIKIQKVMTFSFFMPNKVKAVEETH